MIKIEVVMKDLPRTFIYRDKRELDEFLQANTLNEKIYDIFLDVKDSYYNLKISADKIFNEVYYQCTRLMLDPHPEASVWKYLNDAKENTGWRYTSDLVFSMVYALLSLQPSVSSPIKRFLRILKGKGLNDCYFTAFQEFVESELARQMDLIWIPYVPCDFSPCPEPPERINHYGTFLWSDVTNDYDEDRIKFIVNLWMDKDDKLAILDKIENAYHYDKDFYGPHIEDPDYMPF